MSEELDFGKLFEASASGVKAQINTGERVTGKVTSIGKSTVFVDLGAISDGIIDKKDLMDGEGKLKVKVGDTVTAVCMGWTDEGYKLAVKMSNNSVDSSIQDAFETHLPIEGKVIEERKGGFTVQVAGSNAFCPFSQIDARGVKKEPAEYIGQTYSFMISEFSDEGKNIVLSRRVILEEEAKKMRQYLKDMLQVGDVREGTVVKLMPFGAFVDLGGIQGLVPASEIGWSRGIRVEDALSEGQHVTVKVIALQWDDDPKKERITLSIKQAEQNPWDRIAEGNDPDYQVGSKRTGHVSRIADFGVFVELEPGVDGLAHISQLGREERVEKCTDVCQVGDSVDVTILAVDAAARRISLCFGEPKQKDEKPAELDADAEAEIAASSVGELLEGEVDSVKPFGVFIKLPNGQTGLLHISQIRLESQGPARFNEMSKLYPLHSQVKVVVKEASGNRISLTTPDAIEEEQEKELVRNFKDEGNNSFGTLDGVFGNLKI